MFGWQGFPLPNNVEICRYTFLCTDRDSSIVLLSNQVNKEVPFEEFYRQLQKGERQGSRKRFPVPHGSKAKGYYAPSFRTTWEGVKKKPEGLLEGWAWSQFSEPDLRIHWLPGTTWVVVPEDPNSTDMRLHASSYTGMAGLLFLNKSRKFNPKQAERITKRFSVRFYPPVDTLLTSDWASKRTGWYSDLIDLLIPESAQIYWAEDLKGQGMRGRSEQSRGRKPAPPLPPEWDLLSSREGFMVSTSSTLFSGREEANVLRQRAYDYFGLRMQSNKHLKDRPEKVLIMDEPRSRHGGRYAFTNVSEIVALVKRLGLEPIHVNNTESLSFKNLVTLLHSAMLTIWPSGWDGMTNMIFQQSGGATLEVVPRGQHSTTFHSIANHIGLSYASLFAFEQQNQSPLSPHTGGVDHHTMLMEHQIVGVLRGNAMRQIWVSNDFIRVFNASLPYTALHPEVNTSPT